MTQTVMHEYLHEYLQKCETKKSIVPGTKWKWIRRLVATIIAVENNVVLYQMETNSYVERVSLESWIDHINCKNLVLIKESEVPVV